MVALDDAEPPNEPLNEESRVCDSYVRRFGKIEEWNALHEAECWRPKESPNESNMQRRHFNGIYVKTAGIRAPLVPDADMVELADTVRGGLQWLKVAWPWVTLRLRINMWKSIRYRIRKYRATAMEGRNGALNALLRFWEEAEDKKRRRLRRAMQDQGPQQLARMSQYVVAYTSALVAPAIKESVVWQLYWTLRGQHAHELRVWRKRFRKTLKERNLAARAHAAALVDPAARARANAHFFIVCLQEPHFRFRPRGNIHLSDLEHLANTTVRPDADVAMSSFAMAFRTSVLCTSRSWMGKACADLQRPLVPPMKWQPEHVLQPSADGAVDAAIVECEAQADVEGEAETAKGTLRCASLRLLPGPPPTPPHLLPDAHGLAAPPRARSPRVASTACTWESLPAHNEFQRQSTTSSASSGTSACDILEHSGEDVACPSPRPWSPHGFPTRQSLTSPPGGRTHSPGLPSRRPSESHRIDGALDSGPPARPHNPPLRNVSSELHESDPPVNLRGTCCVHRDSGVGSSPATVAPECQDLGPPRVLSVEPARHPLSSLYPAAVGRTPKPRCQSPALPRHQSPCSPRFTSPLLPNKAPRTRGLGTAPHSPLRVGGRTLAPLALSTAWSPPPAERAAGSPRRVPLPPEGDQRCSTGPGSRRNPGHNPNLRGLSPPGPPMSPRPAPVYYAGGAGGDTPSFDGGTRSEGGHTENPGAELLGGFSVSSVLDAEEAEEMVPPDTRALGPMHEPHAPPLRTGNPARSPRAPSQS